MRNENFLYYLQTLATKNNLLAIPTEFQTPFTYLTYRGRLRNLKAASEMVQDAYYYSIMISPINGVALDGYVTFFSFGYL